MAANERKDDLYGNEIRYTDQYGNSHIGYSKDGYVYQDAEFTKPIETGSVVNTANGYYRKGNYGSYKMGTAEDYKDQMQGYLQQINNRGKFQFDLNGDALYQQYKDQYSKLGKQAMEDTMGQATGLTGGYGSTYSQNAGQQAYNAYLDKLNDVVPDIYAQQKSNWDDETTELYNRYSAANSAYETAKSEQEDADSRVLSFIQMGIEPSAADVAKSGYSDEDISKLMAYYSGTSTGNTGSTGSTGGGGGDGDTGKEYGSGMDYNAYADINRKISRYVERGEYDLGVELFKKYKDQFSEEQYATLRAMLEGN